MMKLGNGVLVQKNIFLFQFFIVCARFFIQFSVLIHKKKTILTVLIQIVVKKIHTIFMRNCSESERIFKGSACSA